MTRKPPIPGLQWDCTFRSWCSCNGFQKSTLSRKKLPHSFFSHPSIHPYSGSKSSAIFKSIPPPLCSLTSTDAKIIFCDQHFQSNQYQHPNQFLGLTIKQATLWMAAEMSNKQAAVQTQKSALIQNKINRLCWFNDGQSDLNSTEVDHNSTKFLH